MSGPSKKIGFPLKHQNAEHDRPENVFQNYNVLSGLCEKLASIICD